MDEDLPITELLTRWREGDEIALKQLTPYVYDELRHIAAALFYREAPGHTLQPTALVHEAFINLSSADVSWENRAHFFALAARMMRRILLDHARSRNAQKRGGAVMLVTFDEDVAGERSLDIRLFDLDKVLGELALQDSRKAELIELRQFGGLQIDEIAEVTGLSVSTVQRDLRFATAWLSKRLADNR